MKLHIKPITLVLCAMLAGGAVAVALLLPGTLDSRRTLEIERAATPTPTADVRSMLMVTLDPANTPAPTPMLLKTGVKGDEVTRLQQRLKELGYYNGEVDGQYGPGTAEAVRVFQAQHGLDSDGIAGEATRTRLYAQDAQTCVPTVTPTATPSLLKRATPATPCGKCSSASRSWATTTARWTATSAAARRKRCASTSARTAWMWTALPRKRPSPASTAIRPSR